jgi:hypothetical protein
MARTLQPESVVCAKPAPKSKGESYRRVLDRVHAKQQVIEGLIEGRFSLLEAAARFRAAQAMGAEDGECLCRSVIGWAYLALCDRPERAETLSQEWEEQLEGHLAGHGGLVCLPSI